VGTGDLYAPTPEVEFLASRSSLDYRSMQVMPVRPAPEGASPPLQAPTPRSHFSLMDDAAAVHRIALASVYESLVIKEFGQFVDDRGDKEDRRIRFPRAPNSVLVVIGAYDSPLLDALAVRFLFSDKPLPASKAYALRSVGDSFYVYERTDPLPR